MGVETAISWCDHTFNPWWGCVKVSPACQHCYAETFAKRVGQKVWGVESPRRFFGPKHWAEPLKWNAAAVKAGVRRRVFCASMADVFEDRSDLLNERLRLFQLIDDTPQLDWLLLTKRPENLQRLLPGWWSGKPWPNVWLGTTAENQEYANERIAHLLGVPAVIRFISAEPLLGSLDLERGGWSFLRPLIPPPGNKRGWKRGLDWVIAGGESGANCRPSISDWFRTLRDQCVSAGVPFHFKQWGGVHAKANGRELDGREWLEFPKVKTDV